MMSQEERFIKIMDILKGQTSHLTSSQICKQYVNNYTSSDTGSTCQILNVLTLAGLVEKITYPRKGSGKQFCTAYKLVNK